MHGQPNDIANRIRAAIAMMLHDAHMPVGQADRLLELAVPGAAECDYECDSYSDIGQSRRSVKTPAPITAIMSIRKPAPLPQEAIIMRVSAPPKPEPRPDDRGRPDPKPEPRRG